MRSGLPPLKSLEALAVVGRAESIAKAAKLLHLTPSAVSHRIGRWMRISARRRSTGSARRPRGCGKASSSTP
jgi:hypothetical protein